MMKYIKDRNQYKINEILDSDNINPEFGQTMVGGLLHRFLGFGRSLAKGMEVTKYSKELDRLLASMCVSAAVEGNLISEDDLQMVEDNQDDIENIIAIEGIENAVIVLEQKGIEGKKEASEILKKALPPNVEQLGLEEGTKKFITYITAAPEKEETGLAVVPEFKEGMIVYHKETGNKLEILKVNKEEGSVLAKNEEGKEGKVKFDNLEIKKDTEESKKPEGQTLADMNTLAKNIPVGGEIIYNGETYIIGNPIKGGGAVHQTTKKGSDEILMIGNTSKDYNGDEKFASYDKITFSPETLEKIKSKKDDEENNKSKAQKDIKEYTKRLNVLRNMVTQCGATKTFAAHITSLETKINSLTGEVSQDQKDQLDKYFTHIENKLKDCKSNDNYTYLSIIDTINIIIEQFDIIIENQNAEPEEATVVGDDDYLTQRQFNRVRADLEKAAKKWKITKEEVQQIDKEVSKVNPTDIGEISGQQAKALMKILNKAKNSLLHTKPYDEIRKNQKRNFDKLDSGRAINRKGYQTWVQKVNEILSYYKDKVKMPVITLISDSLDKSNISNDYVTLHKEFLGLNPRSNSTDKNREELLPLKKGDIIHYKSETNRGMTKAKVIKLVGSNSVQVRTITNQKLVTIRRNTVKEIENDD